MFVHHSMTCPVRFPWLYVKWYWDPCGLISKMVPRMCTSPPSTHFMKYRSKYLNKKCSFSKIYCVQCINSLNIR